MSAPGSLDFFADWLEAKEISPNCPTCGASAPSVHSENGEAVLDVVLAQGGGELGSNTFPEYRIICRNCGYIRSFAAAVVENG